MGLEEGVYTIKLVSGRDSCAPPANGANFAMCHAQFCWHSGVGLRPTAGLHTGPACRAWAVGQPSLLSGVQPVSNNAAAPLAACRLPDGAQVPHS